MVINNNFYMNLAIDKAWEFQGFTYPNPAVGSLILYKNEIIAIEAHQKAGTSHSEILAYYQAYLKISNQQEKLNKFDSQSIYKFLISLPKNFFSETVLYVTLEPCASENRTPSCAKLISILKPKKVFIGSLDKTNGGISILKKNDIDFEVLNSKKADDLIEPFYIWQHRAFVLFKIAQTVNGKIGGGYLSSQKSLEHTHKIRTFCSKLLIGGNTVRKDKPILDSRFIKNGKPPDVIIYSKNKNFDLNIPLFKIKNRNVEIVNNLDFMNKPSFILVEGGEKMMKALANKIDWLLVYQTPKILSNNITYNLNINLKFLHSQPKDIDITLWNRNEKLL